MFSALESRTPGEFAVAVRHFQTPVSPSSFTIQIERQEQWESSATLWCLLTHVAMPSTCKVSSPSTGLNLVIRQTISPESTLIAPAIPLVSMVLARLCLRSRSLVVWIDIAVDHYANPQGTRFGNYMQGKVIMNYGNRTGTARHFPQVPNTNEWYFSIGARQDLQDLLTAASNVDNAQNAMKRIVQSYAGSIGYRLRDNQAVQALAFAVQNPRSGTSAEIRELVTRVLTTNNQARSNAGPANMDLATDLNWIFNNVEDVLKHHTTAYLLYFCDESAARLFFNYLVQTT